MKKEGRNQRKEEGRKERGRGLIGVKAEVLAVVQVLVSQEIRERLGLQTKLN